MRIVTNKKWKKMVKTHQDIYFKKAEVIRDLFKKSSDKNIRIYEKLSDLYKHKDDRNFTKAQIYTEINYILKFMMEED